MAKTWVALTGMGVGVAGLYLGVGNFKDSFNDAQAERGRADQAIIKDVGEAIGDIPHTINISFIDQRDPTEIQPYETNLINSALAATETVLGGLMLVGSAMAAKKKL